MFWWFGDFWVWVVLVVVVRLVGVLFAGFLGFACRELRWVCVFRVVFPGFVIVVYGIPLLLFWIVTVGLLWVWVGFVDLCFVWVFRLLLIVWCLVCCFG